MKKYATLGQILLTCQMQLAYIFGRTPRLALKELEVTATILPFRWSLISVQPDVARLKPDIESVPGNASYSHFLSFNEPETKAALLQLQKRLGGTLRTVYLHKQCPQQELQTELLRMIESTQQGEEGKLTLGMSVWGHGLQAFHVAKGLKKQLQATGRSVRVVIPQQGYTQLSTAQVVHNNLAYFPDEGKKMELVCIKEGKEWWIGCTLAVQDIESYSKRDFSIPAPDPISGMLSPKLAQTMINLAVKGEKATVYDPFCGNGRILLESWYMGLPAYGSDIMPKKVSATQENLAWLAREFQVELPDPASLAWEMDATTSEAPLKAAEKITGPWHVVGEPYLGKPLRALLTSQEAAEWLLEVTPLYEQFLKTWAATTHKPDSLLLVFPRAKVQGGSEAAVYDQVVDRLGEFGYTSEVLFCYDRPDSYVRRDLVQLSYTR